MANTALISNLDTQHYGLKRWYIQPPGTGEAWFLFRDLSNNLKISRNSDITAAPTPTNDASTTIDGSVWMADIFGDWEVAGNSSTVATIVWMDYTDDAIWMQRYDTDTDALLGSPLNLTSEESLTHTTGVNITYLPTRSDISVCMDLDGDIHIVARPNRDDAEAFHIIGTGDYSGGGSNWSHSTTVHPYVASNSIVGSVKLLPALNEGDNGDIYALVQEGTDNTMKVHHYDASGGTFDAVHTLENCSESAAGHFYDFIQNQATNDTFISYWTYTDSSLADLVFYRMTDASSIETQVEIFTNQNESGNVEMSYDQTHRRLYLFFCGDGSGTYASANDTFSIYSDDEGATWSTPEYRSEDGASPGSDAAWGVGVPSVLNADGGGTVLVPVWIELDGEVMTANRQLAIPIAASAPPVIVRADDAANTVRGATRYAVRGSGSVAAGGTTVSPDAVVFTLNTPAPTLSFVIRPDPVVFTLGVPTPTLTATLVPDPVVFTIGVPTPTLTATLVPDPVVFTLGIGTPIVSQASLITPDPVVFTLGVPTPVLSLTANPDPVVFTLSVPAPLITVTLVPDPVAFNLGVATPNMKFVTAPDPVAFTLGVPAPSMAFEFAPDPVVFTIGVPTPTLTITLVPSPVVFTFTVVTPSFIFGISIPINRADVSWVPTITSDVSAVDTITSDVSSVDTNTVDVSV